MKTAIIYFEGKEVCRVEFDGIGMIGDQIIFSNSNREDIGSFPDTYGFVVLTEEQIKAQEISLV